MFSSEPKSNNRKVVSILLITIVFAALLVSASYLLLNNSENVNSIAFNDFGDEGLNFLANVAGLDIAHYSVQKSGAVMVQDNGSETAYTLTCGSDKIDASIVIRNDKVVWCKLHY
jgi:hypothetical protein